MTETGNEQGTQWLSRGVEELLASLHPPSGSAPAPAFDVVVVGSGYGGSIAAATLAGTRRADGQPVTVCVLERGREYLPGAFPAGAADIPGHLRWSTPATPGPQGKPEGLFDMRLGPDLNALVANGLGGGSLINAGVMLEPDERTLEALGIALPGLAECFAEARALLDTPAGNTILRHADYAGGASRPLKFEALKVLHERMGKDSRFEAVPISVAMVSGANSAGVHMDACIQCGDCATGCNHNAKLSLDTNLLVRARANGASIYTGATVLNIEAVDGAWCLHVVYTDATLRRRHPSAFKVRARKVILAAGTFGSTEILLRSRSGELPLPPRLGQGFSSNGDMIAVAYDYPAPANAVADGRIAPDQRRIGPTITARIETTGAQGSRLCFEELAVPAALRRVFEEMSTTAAALHHLGRIDWSVHAADGVDPCAVNAQAIAHSTILAIMGDDGADGELELTDQGGQACGDGAIRVRWPALRDHALFAEQVEAIPVAAQPRGKSAPSVRETVLPNPVWRLLPAEMENMIVAKRGPLTTAHPLGGCAIGPEHQGYVVNQIGQVHLGPTHAGAGTLVVLDGAIVPGALGVNPALTIAALALRATRALLTEWDYEAAGTGRDRAPPALSPSPRMRAACAAASPAPTEVDVVERLSGPAWLRAQDGSRRQYMVQLTLRYARCDVAKLSLPQDGAGVQLRRTLLVDQAHSEVAVFDLNDWEQWVTQREGGAARRPGALALAPLAGKLDFMQREPSGPWRRILRGAAAWLRNRGARDTWQLLRNDWRTRALLRRRQAGEPPRNGLGQWLRSLAMLASRAGEVRRFDYQLDIAAPSLGGAAQGPRLHGRIAGHKRLTYACLSNPWTQLTELELTEFPGLAGSARLTLDTDFLVEENAPLLRIITQQDQPSALLDLIGLAGLLARVVLNVHMWTFRKPDAPRARTPQRMPGIVSGLPAPQVSDVPVDQLPDGARVCARLTRYQRADTVQPPVVLVHGYSTSGTAFSHPKVNPNLAGYLWNAGRDVWVLDLRTSSGLPFARLPWSFEQVALADIPAAIDLVCRASGQAQVDLMAHCMGGAMTGMAVLAELKTGERFYRERALLPSRIRRLVLSQVGPLVVFTQANVFRAYLMHYVSSILPRIAYTFRVEGEPTLGDELLDRLLSSMPYPRHELAIENPWWPFADTSFTGTRHRMDALYGRDFELANVGRNILDNLDDFFGPLNLVTVSQSIHFARRKTITNRAGRNVYVARARLARWRFPTLCIHGTHNGLSSVATLARMAAVLGDAHCTVRTLPIPGFGHQDSWLGRRAVKVFAPVAAFLAGDDSIGQAPAQAAPRLPLLLVPAAGPVWIGSASQGNPVGAAGSDQFSLMCSPVLPNPTKVLCVPVMRMDEHFVNADGFVPACRAWDPHADDDGWLRIARDPGLAGPDGTLVLIVYDEALVVAGPPGAAMSRFSGSLDPRSRLQKRRRWPRPAQAEPSEWSELPDALRQELQRLLENTPAAQLEAGVLAPPQTDSGPRITFAVGSCQYPAGLLDSEPAYQSYARLAARLRAEAADAPAFLVLAGDQIYSDASAGLFDPTALDDRYKRPYEKLFSNRHVREVMRQRPAYMMLDDHEIGDNWAPHADGAARAAKIAGCEGYRKYQRAYDVQDNAMWYPFENAGQRFFMADTRSEREARSLRNLRAARIMGKAQMDALKLWLLEAHEGPRFVVTSSMLGLRRRALLGAGEVARLRCDGWEGYPASMAELLAHIVMNKIDHVVFLSGDEHLSCDTRLTLWCGERLVQVRSVHASPLYAPYPFANAREDEFAASPDYSCFEHVDDVTGSCRLIHCVAYTEYKEDAGFTLVTVGPDGQLDLNFDRAPPKTGARPPASPYARRQTPPPSGSAPQAS
ncbi:alpha/beta fold hydrolase [Massilia sp. CCM 8734]|uniref:alpha/beta fold hydrolase n=1 Tax=Massilia sp. CCM 8734 TaxID=2609283 RepID=UPI00141EBD03|nr:alpha/beta fold hydrolase [Massilia sp. CCM 8734]NHZ94211.1 alpha/beta fold hydrolase [Massilia sp. CCM 8734]